ncbi:hypothetical protein [Aestuariirhabdus litorea]|uniref:Uncharacterized protein n=1 Tax=Aestuariirhabdus litorea TaxID=2528527 RepID=A0A3P3VKX2_9GAMM|nr:hypothetical protein [Aestuariirhabdus litorea]RRJ83034.1 hypothetical protein D0544_14415 [Aestuariirhabdus litorea]RWW93192.1 hypothetical protein DZC74_14390 [Endozoicomonadaceae bacterium GTF-13]
MTASLISIILEIDQLTGSIERLQRQQIDTRDPCRCGFTDGRNELANYTTRALGRLRLELMGMHLEQDNTIANTRRKQAPPRS